MTILISIIRIRICDTSDMSFIMFLLHDMTHHFLIFFFNFKNLSKQFFFYFYMFPQIFSLQLKNIWDLYTLSFLFFYIQTFSLSTHKIYTHCWWKELYLNDWFDSWKWENDPVMINNFIFILLYIKISILKYFFSIKLLKLFKFKKK